MSEPPKDSLKRDVGLVPATAIVVANMIGAGIFTTTGFQVAALGSPLYIYVLWIVGGVLAISGALCYGELGAAIPKAGGEYVYLREAFGGSFAFMSFFVSLTAGFPAPIASASKSLGVYLGYFFPVLANDVGWFSANNCFALCVVWLLVLIHCRRTQFGLGVTSSLTALKVLGIVVIILAALFVGKGDAAGLWRVSTETPVPSGTRLMGALGTSLIFVVFCYSGWNSASYLAGELREPGKTLPRALLLGTSIVLLCYLGLNLVYFYGARAEELAGHVEVAVIASQGLFGPVGTALVTAVLSVSLLAAAAAMTVVGPRVYYALGRDFPPLGALSRTHPVTRVPVVALVVQGLVTSAFIVVGRVDQLQQYAGFTLTLFSTLAILSVIVLRVRRPELPRPFKTWGYPFTPLLFIGMSVWMMFWALEGRPTESLSGLATVAIGGLLHLFWNRRAGSRAA